MRLVFWQNTLSPHQLPYISELPHDERVDEVVVVAPHALDAARAAMGWQLPDTPGLRTVIAPTDEEARALVTQSPNQSWHIYSGLRAFPDVLRWLRLGLGERTHRALVTELPNTYDFRHQRANAKPLWLHRLRFLLRDRGLARHVGDVFAMGEQATHYFSTLGLGWHVHNFCYCTTPPPATTEQPSGGCRFVYVGSLSPRKAPQTLVAASEEVAEQLRSAGGTVDLVGDGPERAALERRIARAGLGDVVRLLGTRPMAEARQLMAGGDALVLPSAYDGWGAVVNEALQAGLYTIVSTAAGAATLLARAEGLGETFAPGDTHALAQAMRRCLADTTRLREQRNTRRRWADSNLSGRVLAKYFVDRLVAGVLRNEKPT